ncbi:probable E3 ubiquitin-protein ligase makorin-1 isoform X1 [Microplitis mediator]|uniref:probable E3 ubiquitin-protein ligase makorin-1 isoform X1 n=2 Tax=Microplitis mediator TaxID=375433 RepID=UPI0025579F8A|nr:probable E3 ubiquitin-protein ligase makorin-1 isoform X1 [Microplitis mediator]
MADDWTRSIVCRYYKNGLCREGDNCRYRHSNQQSGAEQDEMTDADDSDNNTSEQGTSSVPCRFYKWGTCKFGNRCRYIHTTSTSNPGMSSGNRSDDQELDSGQNSGSSVVASSLTDTAHSSSTSFPPAVTSDKSNKNNYEPNEWVKAPEFVPTTLAAINCALNDDDSDNDIDMLSIKANKPESYARAVNNSGQTLNPASEPLCPYAESSGVCKKLECPYLHGDICELCGSAALHPFNKERRQQHTSACIKQHEADMELSFAVQRSRSKACGVCFEVIMEKTSREQRRFGILPNCNHCFCLSCIRKWRQAKQFDNKIIRSCPECRISSDFVCPSIYWVDTKEEKEKLIVEYKGALSQKDCKYFNKGQGKCPFGNKCFYLHALPDGTKTDVGPPARQASHSSGEIDLLQQLILWNFLEERDNRWIYMDDHDEVVVVYSDSEDSVW